MIDMFFLQYCKKYDLMIQTWNNEYYIIRNDKNLNF